MYPSRAAPDPPYRKLVSVRHISLVKPLASSETHEVVMVDGWPVVVGKGQFAVEQQVLYFAIDCVLPLDDKRYESYRFSQFSVELHGQKGWAIQTVKHEGHVSQGMVLRIDDTFPEIVRAKKEIDDWWSGLGPRRCMWHSDEKCLKHAEKDLLALDFKEDLRIRKWVRFCISLGGPAGFLPTTKSERFQNIPDLWKTHGSTEFQITELLDGISVMFYDVFECHRPEDGVDLHSDLPGVILLEVRNEWEELGNGVCCREFFGISRGDHDYEETEASISWKALRDQGIANHYAGNTGGMGLAGVLCGEGILGNCHMLEGRRFHTFGECDDKFKAWEPLDGGEWCETVDSLEPVPRFAQRVRLSAFAKDMDELMRKSQGETCKQGGSRVRRDPYLKRKGLVFRALDGSFSFKVIANDWLLDETEKLREAGKDKVVCRPGPNDCV